MKTIENQTFENQTIFIKDKYNNCKFIDCHVIIGSDSSDLEGMLKDLSDSLDGCHFSGGHSINFLVC